MKKVSGSSLVRAKLHHRIEAKVMRTAVDLNQPRLSAAKARRLVEDLQIHHQVELELQNQTLLEMRQQLEQSLKRYTDLYDFAPVGYATLASDGAIQEINRAGAKLLGMECAHLIERRLGLFVSADTRPVFKVISEDSHTMQAGRIRISHLGNSGCRSNRASTACMVSLDKEMPFL